MKNDSQKPILKFEPGSRQPFILYLISITIITAVIVIVCLLTSGLSLPKPSEDIIGDINLDGSVNSADILLLSQYLSGNADFNDKQLIAADVDTDGAINTKDSILLMQHLGLDSLNNSVPTTSPQPTESTTGSDETDDNTSAQIEEEPTSESETTAPQIDIDFISSGKSHNSAFVTGENGVYYVARITNSWKSSDGRYMYQIEMTVKNNSSKTVYNTSADINLNETVTVEKNWDCTASVESTSVKIKTSNDGKISVGGTFNCGFIISAGCPITINSVTK